MTEQAVPTGGDERVDWLTPTNGGLGYYPDDAWPFILVGTFLVGGLACVVLIAVAMFS